MKLRKVRGVQSHRKSEADLGQADISVLQNPDSLDIMRGLPTFDRAGENPAADHVIEERVFVGGQTWHAKTQRRAQGNTP